MSLYQAKTRYFCVGVETDLKGIITDAPPIVRWAIGKPIIEFGRWVCRRGGTLELVSHA